MKDPKLISSSMGTESFPPKVRNKTGMSTLTTVIQHSIASLSLSSQTVQRRKCIQIGLEEVKLSFFTDDMIFYTEIPKDPSKKPVRTNP